MVLARERFFFFGFSTLISSTMRSYPGRAGSGFSIIPSTTRSWPGSEVFVGLISTTVILSRSSSSSSEWWWIYCSSDSTLISSTTSFTNSLMTCLTFLMHFCSLMLKVWVSLYFLRHLDVQYCLERLKWRLAFLHYLLGRSSLVFVKSNSCGFGTTACSFRFSSNLSAVFEGSTMHAFNSV